MDNTILLDLIPFAILFVMIVVLILFVVTFIKMLNLARPELNKAESLIDKVKQSAFGLFLDPVLERKSMIKILVFSLLLSLVIRLFLEDG